MNRKQLTLSRVYRPALRTYLKQAPAASLQTARGVGQQAVALGLGTLDLAKIHEAALLVLIAPKEPGAPVLPVDAWIRLSNAFFIEAITPIEEAHRGACEANIQLAQRTTELAASNDELKREISRREAIEASLRTSETTTSRLLEESLRLQKELRQLSRELLKAQEEERKRISRELHDVIAQTLAGINIRLATLRSKNRLNAQELNREIAQTQRLVEQSVDAVHRFARDLRPAVLDDLGLIPALQAYLEGFMERTGIRVNFAASAELGVICPERRIVLYRVAQESLTNVARHAQASLVDVSIERVGGVIIMEVHDNGVGFQMHDLTSPNRSNGRLGILGMRERVEMEGGTFSVESAPGQQTTVRVNLPLDGRKPKSSGRKRTQTAGARSNGVSAEPSFNP